MRTGVNLQHPVIQVIFGAVIAIFGAALQWVLWPWVGPSRFILFLPAVMIASLFGGGIIAGSAATFVSVLTVVYFFMPLLNSLKVSESGAWLQVFIFVLTSLSISVLVQFMNVRTKKLADAEMRAEGAQRLTFAAEAANVGIWEWDVQKDQMKWDDQMLKFYGITRESFSGTVDSWQRGLHPGDRARANQILQESFLGKTKFKLEFRVVRPDGAVRTIFASALVVRDYNGKVKQLFGLNRDITDEKRAMEKLKSACEVAESAARARTRFLDIAAHELRTPVTAFSLLLQMTELQMEKGQAVEISTLKRMRVQADRLAHLVVDLLEVARLERGFLKLKRQRTDLSALISECRLNFEMQFPDRRFLFSEPLYPVEITVDPVRIYEVISNLIDNAVKYTPAGTPIEISMEKDLTRVRVAVKDRGSGIPPERQKELFKVFDRGEDAEEVRYAGLGLGLFICRGLVELHGGSIGVKSQMGVGSTFYFEIPFEIPREIVLDQAAS